MVAADSRLRRQHRPHQGWSDGASSPLRASRVWTEFSAVGPTSTLVRWPSMRSGTGGSPSRTPSDVAALLTGLRPTRFEWRDAGERVTEGFPRRRLARLRSDGVPGTGAVRSPRPPARLRLPAVRAGACGDLVGPWRRRLAALSFRPTAPRRAGPPSGDAGEDGDEDQDRGHEDQRRPLLDEQVEHRTAAARATAHLDSSAVGGGPGSPGGVDAVMVRVVSRVAGDVRQRVADARLEHRSSGRRSASLGRSWSGPSTSPPAAPTRPPPSSHGCRRIDDGDRRRVELVELLVRNRVAWCG